MFRARSLPTRLAAALGLSAAVGLALPVGATEHCYQPVPDGPEFCTEQVWFQPAQTPVGNLAATGQTSLPGWSTSEPTQSVAQGAGGMYATNGVQRQMHGESNEATGARFVGSFTGDLDNLAVTMYLFAPGRQQESTYYGGVDVVVDGKTVLTVNDEFLPLAPGGSAVLRTDFAVSRLHRAMERAGVQTGPDVEHQVELFVTSYTLATSTAVLVYGTTEVPSTMTFNVSDLTGSFKL